MENLDSFDDIVDGKGKVTTQVIPVSFDLC